MSSRYFNHKKGCCKCLKVVVFFQTSHKNEDAAIFWLLFNFFVGIIFLLQIPGNFSLKSVQLIWINCNSQKVIAPHSQFVRFCQVYRPRPYFDLLSVSVFSIKINTAPERYMPIPVSSNICLPRRTKTHILHLCFKSSIWFILKNFKLNFSNFPKHLFLVLYWF